VRVHGTLRGFEIVGRGRVSSPAFGTAGAGGLFAGSEASLPELFIRGVGTLQGECECGEPVGDDAKP